MVKKPSQNVQQKDSKIVNGFQTLHPKHEPTLKIC